VKAPGKPPLRRIAFVLILCLAAGTRATWALLVPVRPTSDSFAYDTFARNIAAGEGYGWTRDARSAYWPVGTSALYAFLYLVFGSSYTSIVVANIVLGVGIALLTTYLASKWYGAIAGVCAGALYAVWPSQVEFTTVLASELPFMFAMLVAISCWSPSATRSWQRAIAAGIALGVATLIRPQALLLPVVLAISSIAGRDGWWRVCRFASIAGVVALLTVVPWSLRNVKVFGTFVLVSTNGGVNLWMGNNPDSEGGYMPPPPHVQSLTEPERNRVLRQEALDYIHSDPAGFLARSAVKLVRLHDRETIGVHWNTGFGERFGARASDLLKSASTAFWWFALAAALLGTVITLRRSGLRAYLASPAPVVWMYFAVIHAAIVIQDRYHFPSIPSIAALAGIALAELGGLVVRRGTPGVVEGRAYGPR
jgi:4-amino-4-deoxy-L-arabinose transferase-like glycosyltransferase